MIDKEQFLWVEKYRPKKVADCILSPELKDTFSNYVKDNKIPNMINGNMIFIIYKENCS